VAREAIKAGNYPPISFEIESIRNKDEL